MISIKSIFKHWLPLAVVTTCLCGLVYLSVQQLLRVGANDPQIQMAEDAAAALGKGESPADLLPDRQVDIAASLAPFLVIYDDQGVPQASSGVIHGELPELPPGVFQYVEEKGEDRITWQPEPGVRVAAVVTGLGGDQPGYVMAGRSLRESESRTDQFGLIVGAAWVTTILSSLVVVVLLEFLFRHKPS